MLRAFLCLLPLVCWANSYEVITSEETLPILTPTLQERTTRKIAFANGLEAYIISDPRAEKCAAAMSVEAGCFSDPPEYPGMAHFCEHMLFMGSEKYPDENYAHRFIHENQGMTNAYTWTDRTVYIFAQNATNFDQSLDIFAQFFIAPLFKEGAINRELLAVNQEHMKNIENDMWRNYSVFKEMANKKHPVSKFSTGTKETLQVISRDELIAWYKENYTSDGMHLVVYGSQSLDELTEYVTKSFQAVPATTSTKKTKFGNMLPDKQCGQLVTIEPFKDLRQLELRWEIPEKHQSLVANHVTQFVSSLLNDRGENSLFRCLQNKGLIEDMGTDLMRFSKYDALFTISFDLTPLGVEEMDTVVTATFEMLQNLQKQRIADYHFDEYKQLLEMNFQYQSRQSAYDYVEHIASELIDESLESYPQPHIPKNFSMRQAYDILSCLQPSRCMYFLTANPELTKTTAQHKTPWYGANFSKTYLGGQRIAHFAHSSVDKTMCLSNPNNYIPSSEDIKVCCTHEETVVPTKLVDEPSGVCFYAQDHYYGSPKSYVSLGIRTPLVEENAKGQALLDLYTSLLGEKLLPLLSEGARAGQQFSVSTSDFRPTITFYGYSDKLAIFCKNTITQAKTLDVFTESDVQRMMTELSAKYLNQEKDHLYIQAMRMGQSILTNHKFTGNELCHALQQITYDDVVRFQRSFFSHAYLEAMIHGSIDEATAKALYKDSLSHFDLGTTNKTNVPDHKYCHMRFDSPRKIEQQPDMLGNCALLLIEGKQNVGAHRASVQILNSVLRERFFTTLRSEQQTGYVAISHIRPMENQNIVSAIVQSTTHNAHELLCRFELFFETFCRNLETEIPSALFCKLQKTCIENTKEPPVGLYDKGSQLQKLAFFFDEDFHRKELRIQELQDLTYQEFLGECKELLQRDNPHRLALLYQGKAESANSFVYQPTSKEELCSHREQTGDLR